MFYFIVCSRRQYTRLLLNIVQYHLEHDNWYIPWTFIWVRAALKHHQKLSANSCTDVAYSQLAPHLAVPRHLLRPPLLLRPQSKAESGPQHHALHYMGGRFRPALMVEQRHPHACLQCRQLERRDWHHGLPDIQGSFRVRYARVVRTTTWLLVGR